MDNSAMDDSGSNDQTSEGDVASPPNRREALRRVSWGFMAAALPAGAQNVAPAPGARRPSPPPPPPPPPASTWTIGGHVAAEDWCPSPFVDVVKSSRGFGLRNTWEEDSTGALPRNGAGWPTAECQILITAVGERPGTVWPTGTWKGRYKGAGRIVGVDPKAVGGPTSMITGGSIQNLKRVGNTVTFDWVVTGTPMLGLQFDGPVSDLRIVRPGYSLDGHPLLHPQALDYYKQFHTLRFLDFMGQNQDQNTEKSFATRQPAGKWHGAKSWEAMAAFFKACYEAPGSKVKGIWWNVPWTYTEADCRQLGGLLKPLLPLAAMKFPEFSNELWNGGYWWKFNHYKGRADDPNDADYALITTPDDQDEWGRLARLWALQSARMARAMKVAFPQEFGSNLFPVLAGQFWGNGDLVGRGLSWLSLPDQVTAFGGAPNTYIGSLSAAPYLQGSLEQMDQATDVDAMILGLRTTFDNSLEKAEPLMRAWKALKQQYGIARLDAYEWQLHTHGDNNTQMKLATSLSPQAGELVRDLAHAMRDEGGFQTMCFLTTAPQTPGYLGNGQLFIHTFAMVLNTSFGEQPDSEKYKAIKALIVESAQ